MNRTLWPQIVYDIDGNLLVETSQDISEKVIEKVIEQNMKTSSQVLLSQTKIINDIIKKINSGIYKLIFSNKENACKVINILAQTSFTELIIRELENLKINLPDTYNHILVVAALSIKICLDLNNENFDTRRTAQIGLVHDIGKSRLPVEIIEKDKPLTHEEFKIIQTHPWIDHLLVSRYLNTTKSFVAKAALCHHERLDGSGYPLGIARINNYVQTIIPCDIFDALISQRPYRSEPFTVRAALDILLEESKKGKISNKFVKCLISYSRKDKPHYEDVQPSQINRDPPPRINYYGVREK
ncbi:MAG: HD domain-containing protein [Candidatus Omnitrophica bacterium]|nr:HD domain-containing protein [Candidatus Omnitrophota bacterium]